jgi:hypothetical protein
MSEQQQDLLPKISLALVMLMSALSQVNGATVPAEQVRCLAQYV